jgi:mgtE-like transporter
LICGALGILSGAILGGRIEGLVGLPSVLIMLPAFLADGGAIGGIVASRLSSALHLGSIDVEGRMPREVIRMFATVHLLGFIIFTMIGSIAFLIAKTLGISTLSLSMTVMVSVLAGEMLLVAVNLIAYYVSIISFKRGIDPDNVSIPTITSVVDVVGVASLIVVLIIVGNSTCI